MQPIEVELSEGLKTKKKQKVFRLFLAKSVCSHTKDSENASVW